MSTTDEPRIDVLIAYGEVMAIVQHWEQGLCLVWASQRKDPRPTGDFDTQRSQKELRRLEAAFFRMTAQAVREAIAPVLDPDTADDLPDLMLERNRLAHRFLREQATLDDNFRAGSRAELISLGNRFTSSLDSLVSTMSGLPSHEGPVLAHWPALADRILNRLFSGEKIPRDPRQQ